MIDPSSIWINLFAFHFMNSIASPLLNTIMGALAESYLIVLPLVGIYLILKKDTNVYAFALAFILLFAIGYGLKAAFMEARPCSVPSLSWINAPSCESGYSFPSDHAMVLTGLALFLLRYRKVLIAYLIWLVIILFGRVYLGQHYLTDVIAGVLMSLIIAYAIYSYKDSIYSIVRKYHLAILTPR